MSDTSGYTTPPTEVVIPAPSIIVQEITPAVPEVVEEDQITGYADWVKSIHEAAASDTSTPEPV